MAKVTFILGLSGSGKTYLAQKMKTESGAKVFENILEDGSSLVVLIECLKEGNDCLIAKFGFVCLLIVTKSSSNSHKFLASR